MKVKQFLSLLEKGTLAEISVWNEIELYNSVKTEYRARIDNNGKLFVRIDSIFCCVSNEEELAKDITFETATTMTEEEIDTCIAISMDNMLNMEINSKTKISTDFDPDDEDRTILKIELYMENKN